MAGRGLGTKARISGAARRRSGRACRGLGAARRMDGEARQTYGVARQRSGVARQRGALTRHMSHRRPHNYLQIRELTTEPTEGTEDAPPAAERRGIWMGRVGISDA